MWPDTETDRDFLNFSEVADLTIDLLRQPGMLPLSIGIFGGWGAGKSSMLQLVKKGLNADRDENGKEKYVIVAFDAWLYQDFDDARAALMEVITNVLLAEAKSQESIFDKAKNLASRVNYFRLIGVGAEIAASVLAGGATFGLVNRGVQAVGRIVTGEGSQGEIDQAAEAVSKTKELGKGLLTEKQDTSPPKEIAAFRRELSEVLESLQKSLVVFIDNLDRCLPKNAIHTLEAIRLFLFLPNTAFVVAVDEDMIRHSVSTHYADPSDRHVTDYLDKLIQVPIRVPKLGVQEIRAYTFMLFASTSGTDGPKLELLRGRLEQSLREGWKQEPVSTDELLRLVSSHRDVLAPQFDLADRLAPVLANAPGIAGNPRIVKRLLNTVQMRAAVARRRMIPLDDQLIAKLAVFERCTDDTVYSHFLTLINDAAHGRAEVIAKLEELRDDAKSFESACPEPWKGKHLKFIRDWFLLDPTLAGRDLRGAIYLSRETMPLRFARGGLSPAATEAIRVLLRVTSISSAAAKAAITNLPPAEHAAVMDALIGELRRATDWNSRPKGFVGANLLALGASDAGEALARFVKSLPTKPPWMKVLKLEPWAQDLF